MNTKTVLVYTDTPFRSYWETSKIIGQTPVRVPHDALCKKMLSDGSLKMVGVEPLHATSLHAKDEKSTQKKKAGK